MSTAGAQQTVRELLASCERLTDLLAEERAAIVKLDHAALNKCAETKERYIEKLAQVSTLAPELAAKVRDPLRALRQDLRRNDSLLRFAQEVQRGAVGQEEPTAYNQRGALVSQQTALVNVRV